MLGDQKPSRLKKAIFWVVGGAAALYFLARYSFSQKAIFLLRSVKPSGTILQPTVTVEIAVQNPTNQRITLKSIRGSVFVNDKYLANVSSFGDQVITGNSESIVKVTARPSGVGVFQSIRQLLTQPIGTIQVRFSGSANVDGINIPIEETKTL
jgi:LEA14-like dessication related protein